MEFLCVFGATDDGFLVHNESNIAHTHNGSQICWDNQHVRTTNYGNEVYCRTSALAASGSTTLNPASYIGFDPFQDILASTIMTNDGGATDMSKCCHVKAEFYVYNDATSVYDLVADPATTYCFISNFVSAAAAVNPASVGEITFEQAASDSCPDSYSPSA